MVSNSTLQLSNFLGVLFLGRVWCGGLEVDRVDTGVFGDLSHSMAPVLLTELSLLSFHVEIFHLADLLGCCCFCQLSCRQ